MFGPPAEEQHDGQAEDVYANPPPRGSDMIGRRLTALGACAGLVLLFGWALQGWSKKAPATPCPAGRFLVDAGNSPLVQGASTGEVDSVTIDGQGRIAVGSGCPAVAGRIRAKRHFTKLTTKWPSCGSAGAGRLNAKIGSPECDVMAGRFKTKGEKAKPFTARLSTCGDGMVDGPNGEQCEPAVGGCASGVTCTAACTCESPLGGPTTTLAPPTTTVTSSTATTTLAPPSTTTVTTSTTTTTGYTCGGLGRRCAGTCPDGQTCVSAGTFPFECECQATCGASAPACNGVCGLGETCQPFPREGACRCVTTTTTTIPCQEASQPACGGSCPPGQNCTFNNITCVCVP